MQIYDHSNTNYSFNGDVEFLNHEFNGKLVLNGEYGVQVWFSYDDEERWKFVKEDNVIKCNTPVKDNQLFRIYEVEKDEEGITAYARHVFFDLSNYVLMDVRPTQKNGQQALNSMLIGTPFKGTSNISTVNTSYFVRMNILQALTDDSKDNSFVNRWGGERLYDNYNFEINSSIGEDRKVTLELGYNMSSINIKINTDDVVTRIIPEAYNGYLLEDDKPYVDSPLINKYAVIKSKVLKDEFADLKLKEDCNEGEVGYDTLEDLRKAMKQRCNELFEKGLDKPKMTASVDIESLKDSLDYKLKGYDKLETYKLGDAIGVYFEPLDINFTTRIVGMEWTLDQDDNVIITNLTLGEIKKNYFDNQSDVSSRVENILSANGVKAESIEGIINALNTKFQALRDIAHPSHVRAIKFEDDVVGSSTYGCMVIGTSGFEIADKKDSNGDWIFRTFGTGKGFTADEIVAGILTAILIQNVDGSFKLDLSKSGGCEFYNNNKLAIKIANNTMDFFASGNTNVNIGSLGSTRASNDGAWDPDGLPYIEMWHNPDDSVIAIGYKDKNNGTIPPYIRFDKSLKYNKSAPIEVVESVCMRDCFDMNGHYFFIDKKRYPDLYLTSSTKGWLWCNGGFVASGDIECKGNKKCIQETKNFGDVSFYATEDMDSYLTYTSPIGEKYKCEETEYMSEYKCIIKIPKIVKETINTNLEYRVYINKLSFGDYKIKTYPSYFVVTSDKPLIFQYYIRGIRKGFENELLKNNMKKYEDKLSNRAKTLYTYRQSKKAARQWTENYGECFEG